MSGDKRDEWDVEPTLMHELGHLVMEGNRPIAICPRESEALRVVADHNARTQLEERVRELEAWVVEHEMHDEGCPQADEYKGEWDASPGGPVGTWLAAHQQCTCGTWELLGRRSLDDDTNYALLSPQERSEGQEEGR